MKKQNNAARGMLVTLMGGILWGFSGTCGQYIFQQEAASSQWVTCVRMLGAGVVLIALGLAKQGRNYAAVWRDKKDAAGLLLFAVLGLMFSQYTYMTAISYSNSGTTTALQCTGQVLVLIYSCILVRRWPTRLESVGVVLAVGGTFLLATHGKLGNLAISPLALAWGMASALSLALYTLLPVRLIKKYGSTVITGWGMLIGGVVLSAATRMWAQPVHLTPSVLLTLAVVVLLGTAGAYSLYLEGVACLGAVKASMIACSEPVAAMVISAVWLHTRFTFCDVLGVAAILSMVLLIARENGKKQGQ